MTSHLPAVRSWITTITLITVLVAACGAATPSATPPPNSGQTAPPISSPAPSDGEASPPPATSLSPSGWRPAAPMLHPRIIFRSALLTDGTLLAVGDDGCGMVGAYPGSEITEIYDPAADKWTKVGSLNKPRGYEQLVALPDGTAMVLGGVNIQDEEFSSTKVYSPTVHAWSDGPLMIRAGVYAAVALTDGTILSVGLGGAEILEPGARAWRRSTAPPNAFVERMFLLADGLVLAVGTNDNEDRDVVFLTFDPDRDAWKRIAAPTDSRSDVIPLDDGSILAIGTNDSGTGVERYDRAADRWVTLASMSTARSGAQATLLSDGRVLVAGGSLTRTGSTEEATDSTEIYNPASDAWTPGPSLLARRQRGYAMTLSDGSVLVYGGHSTWIEPPSPDTGSSDCPAPIAETERLYEVP